MCVFSGNEGDPFQLKSKMYHFDYTGSSENISKNRASVKILKSTINGLFTTNTFRTYNICV